MYLMTAFVLVSLNLFLHCRYGHTLRQCLWEPELGLSAVAGQGPCHGARR